MTLELDALGARMHIESDDLDVDRFLRAALTHLLAHDDRPADGPTIRIERRPNGELRALRAGHEIFAGDAAVTLARVLNAINVHAITSVGADRLVLHCAVAELEDRAVLMPGRPGAGKSTLLAGLVAGGAGYLSDEAGPVGADLHITPYPKPIVLGPGSWEAVPGAAAARVTSDGIDLHTWWLDPARLGCRIPDRPLPVGAVVVPAHRPGIAARAEPLSRAEATLVLASNTFNLGTHGQAGLDAAAALTAGVPTIRLHYADMDDARRIVHDLLAGDPAT